MPEVIRKVWKSKAGLLQAGLLRETIMSSAHLLGRKAVLLSVAAILFLALFPQMFAMLAGPQPWNGSYFVSNYDEPAYSAYVNALIRGEPRKNDPFLGTADSPQTPQPETLYSVQFIPPYAIATPARLLGITASTAFILLAAFIAVFSTMTIYRLLLDVTGDELIAVVGPVVVLCLGTAVAFQGELRNLIDGRLLADFFPYLRRYQPGFAFPIFFLLCLFTWKAIVTESKGNLVKFSLAAGALFVVLVFSYFYLWTAAAAWLACFIIVSCLVDRGRSKQFLTASGLIGAIGTVALIPYFYLLSLRSPNLDSVQLLVHTRMPEFASPSMTVGILIAAAAIFLVRGSETARARLPMIVSFALTPVILFNQQIITGRSLQPVHYELFIANYVVLVAAMLLAAAVRAQGGDTRPLRFQRGLVCLGVAAFGWGLFEAYGSTNRGMTVAAIRDASVPVISAASKDRSPAPIILASNFVTADFIPSVGNARSFWNPHTSSAGGIGVAENKERFYKYLYFSGYTAKDLDAALRANSFEVTAAIFGSERALPSLGSNAKGITAEEIRAESAKFEAYSKGIDPTTAYDPLIDHVIVPAEGEQTLANLDRWYTRDDGRDFGLFRLYRLAQRPAP